jgi:organic hydroperoxide reductase OsmC/OhrA
VSSHAATVAWKLDGGDFLKRRYSRVHRLIFGDGVEIAGSASPSVVPLPFSSHAAVDPEAAFTAALSACHMLWFLDHAARAGLVVGAYEDHAVGALGRGADGRMAMVEVILRPAISFTGEKTPTPAEIEALHAAAHHDCFIANSVSTKVMVQAPL